MLNVAITKFSMERRLLDMPYEMLFEIFRRLPKDKLIEISGLCSKCKDLAGDTRLWKDVYIKYEPNRESTFKNYAFEELYSEPWSVKVIDLAETEINSPVSSQTGRVVKVTELDLSSIRADRVTLKAILNKYQCTELYLDFNQVDHQGRVLGILPEAFSKQTALEVLSLRGLRRGRCYDKETKSVILPDFHQWLAPVFSEYCKSLKSLDLSYTKLTSLDLLGFVENLPTSLEKLYLAAVYAENSFFELLAGSCPNLRVLELCPTRIKCPSLLKLQFLEVLQVIPHGYQDISDLYRYLSKFPALKTVLVERDPFLDCSEPGFKKLQTMLERHGIFVGQLEEIEWSYPADVSLWKVSKTV